jgi:hypothetical protein
MGRARGGSGAYPPSASEQLKSRRMDGNPRRVLLWIFVAASDYRATVDKFVCAFDRFTLAGKLSRSKRLILASSDPDLQTIQTLN